MNIQERIEALETEFNEKIKTLKAEARREQEFPQVGDEFWVVKESTKVNSYIWADDVFDKRQILVGNVFRTKEQAEFAVEKLKVEAELRKFSRPFVWGEGNWYLNMSNDKYIFFEYDNYELCQGVTYFESIEKAEKAISTIGIDRIKKYIFGVED